MVAVLGDWFEALRETFKPGSATGRWNVGGALGKYYKRMIIPLLLAMAIEILLIPWALGALSASSGGAGAVALTGSITYIEVFSLVIAFLLTIPIGIILQAAIYHLFGQMVGAVTKGDYADTVSATMHSAMPGISLYFMWIALVWLDIGGLGGTAVPLIAILVLIILVLSLWQLVVFIYSFAAIHKTTKTKAFLAWLVPFIIGLVVVIAFIVVAGGLGSIVSSVLAPVLGGLGPAVA